MATKKKAVKVIYWKREVEKIERPFRRKFDDLFSKFDEEKKKLGIVTTAENNRLWRDKYEKKYNEIEKQLDKKFDALWLKYHVSLGTTKVREGYQIIV